MLFKQLNPRIRDNSLPSKSKDINKFILNFDSDQEESDEGNLHASTSKLQRLKNIKGVDSNKILPSLMHMSQQQNNYFYEKPQVDRNKKIRQGKAKMKFNIVDLDQEEKIQEQTLGKQQIPSNQITLFQSPQQQQVDNVKKNENPEIQQSNKHKDKQQLKQLNKLEIDNISMSQSNIYSQNFQVHNQEQQKRATMSVTHSSALLFQLESQQEQSQNPHIDNSDLTTCGQEKIGQIINTDADTLRISLQLSNKIGQFKEPYNIRIFLNTPVPDGIVFNFQIHKYKDFMKTQYLFWFQHGQQMALFAMGISDTLYLDKTQYEIFLCPQRYIKWQQKCSFYMGSFVSDFKRQMFTLYNHKNYKKPQVNDKVICTIATVPNYINSKLKSQQIYIPKVVDKANTNIYNNSLTKNLKKMHKLEQFREIITKYTTHSIPLKIFDKLKEQMKICQNTTRNSFVKDHATIPKVLFLKVQKDRFKIRVGSGISPIHVLCYAIVHLQ